MATLKKLLIGIGAFIVAVFIIGLFLPKQYVVERTIIINAQPEDIYANVVDLREWKKWGVWFKRDPNMMVSYSGPDRAIGMRSSWKSETEGDGEMEIMQLEHNKKLVYRLYFPEFDMETTGVFEFTHLSDGTVVTWRDEGKVSNNPIDRYFALMMDSFIGPDFETGLENLKIISENQQ